ncbi:serine/threonine-protein kinase [Frankia sp. CiP1_Cm_nod2]|uniref:serine/threonine-protein kinase n=1 Tax=Frankia sp. CiP1_Cm_nod2 TaxID=2897161 RepID=UPI002025479B
MVLSGDFRYVHGPALERDIRGRLGHGRLADTLRARIDRSEGGAFLIAGFRGAGKTTLVRSTLRWLSQYSGNRRYLPVFLNVARPVTSNEFLFAVTRRVVETLDDTGVLAELEEDIRNSILLAYARTSMSLTSRSEEGHELNRTFGANGQLPFAGLAPKLERGTKTTRSLATEASFLTYADGDVEHDFLRIVEMLGRSRSHGRGRGFRRRRPAAPVHLVVVIDELDKLTSSPRGMESFDEILTVFKNVLTASAAHFIFVAGVDVLDRAVTDSDFGIGIFESVFSWRAYVPCVWDSGTSLLREVCGQGPNNAESVERVANYLDYKGRGVPRRLVQELNDLIVWETFQRTSVPVIRMSPEDVERIGLYADLSDVLNGLLGRSGEEGRSLEEDRFRLGAHYVTDWVLRSEGGVFTATDVVSGERGLSPLLSLSERRVDLVLRHLAANGVIEDQRPGGSGESTFVGGVAQARMATYRLSRRMRGRVLRVARANERESIDLLGGVLTNDSPFPGAAPSPPGAAPSPPGAGPSFPHRGEPPAGADPDSTGAPAGRPHPSPAGRFTRAGSGTLRVPRSERFMGDGRFELVDVLGVGGMGTVYVARDAQFGAGALRAIKVLSPTLGEDQEARSRFLREARIALQLDHPNVVHTYQLLDEPDGRLGIVMDFVHGDGLNQRLRERGFPVAEAVGVATGLLRAIVYLHSLDIVRLDVKPSNVIISEAGRPVMVDFGVARSLQSDSTEVTRGEGLVGTPAYMSPEQIRGGAVDGRTDIFSFGLVLFELLGGAISRDGGVENVMFRRLHEDLDVSVLTCSEELRGLVARCCRRRREERFSDATAVCAALLDVPESPTGPSGPGGDTDSPGMTRREPRGPGSPGWWGSRAAGSDTDITHRFTH